VESKRDISNIIKESFESQSFEAPKDMWSNISTDLNYKKLDSKIKSSFATTQFTAPDFKWSQLESAKIDNKVKESFSAAKFTAPAFDFSALDNGSILDNKISESFEQTVVAAPDDAWDGIQDKMDVNEVWDKLSGNIVVHNRSWTKWVAAASIAILVSVLPSTLKNQEISSNQTFTSPLLVQEVSIDNDNTLITYNNTVPSIDKNNSSPIDHNNSVDFLPSNFEEQTIVPRSLTVNKSLEPVSTDGISSNRINAILDSEIRPLDNSLADIVYGTSVLNDWNENTQHPIERVKQKSSKSSYRIGLIGGLSSSWIFDEDTRESFDKTSLNDSKFSLGQMYGLTADYYFDDNNGIETNILMNSTTKNRVGYYENGVYKIRKTEINYYKMNLLYNRRINFYGKKNNHSITLSGGPYLAFNRSSNVSENETITSLNTQFKKANYGLTFRLGEEIEWTKIVLGYGLNSNLGLRNIFLEESNNQSESSFTNNLDLGLFVSLKYKL
jgi:hypothetical protein